MPQVYFALSSEELFSGYIGNFGLRQFYLGLIRTVMSWPDDDREALLMWWDR